MTPPKRWYQLSILQLLVAMTMVAVFIAANLAANREPYYWNLDSITPAVIWKVEVTAGWPFTYLHRSERPLNVGAESDPTVLEAICIFNENATERTNVTLMPLVENIAAALAFLLLAMFLTGDGFVRGGLKQFGLFDAYGQLYEWIFRTFGYERI